MLHDGELYAAKDRVVADADLACLRVVEGVVGKLLVVKSEAEEKIELEEVGQEIAELQEEKDGQRRETSILRRSK